METRTSKRRRSVLTDVTKRHHKGENVTTELALLKHAYETEILDLAEKPSSMRLRNRRKKLRHCWVHADRLQKSDK